MTRFIARPALAGSVAALAFLVPLAGCGSSSSASTAASTAQSTTTTTPMASPSDSPSMDMTPSASESASAAASESASAAASESASSPTASASSTATATNTAMSGRKMAFSAKKDAKVPATLTPYAALTTKKVTFPKTLGGAPMFGSVSEGDANRYVGYSDPSSSNTVTVTASTNSDAGDVDTQATALKGPSSYDGGRIVCGVNTQSDSQTCVVRLAGNDQLTVGSGSKMANDKLAKLAAEFLNAQK